MPLQMTPDTTRGLGQVVTREEPWGNLSRITLGKGLPEVDPHVCAGSGTCGRCLLGLEITEMSRKNTFVSHRVVAVLEGVDFG